MGGINRALGLVIHEETLRALSYFRGDKIAVDTAVRIL
jgi:hypothetical protein